MDQEDQEQDKEVKIQMEQVYLVVINHQFLHHKEIMEDKVEQEVLVEQLEAVEEPEQLEQMVVVIMVVQVV
jgi:hypothetical protein